MYRQDLLLVEDAPDNLDLILEVLRHRSCTVRTARSAAEALERLGPGEPLPALIILDLMQGALDLLGQIRSQTPASRVPVVVLTGPPVTGTESLGQANSFVQKPSDRIALAERVGLIADYWLKLNIAPGSLATF